MASTDRLLSQLNQTQLAQKDNPTYQVIKQLIQRIKELENLIGLGATTTNITNEIIQQFILGGDGGSGEGEIGPPGIQGLTGNTGATGAMGPVTLGPMGLDADSPEEPWMIPGVIGPQGNQGPSGSHTLVMLGMDGYDGEDGLTVPSLGSGSSAWALLASQVIVAGTVLYDFTGLAGKTEILIQYDDVVRSDSVVGFAQVSSDNGSTFLTTSGNYQGIDTNGNKVNLIGIPFYNTGSTSARTGYCIIYGFNLAQPKIVPSTYSPNGLIIPSATAFNAIRITQSVGTMTSGTLRIFGR